MTSAEGPVLRAEGPTTSSLSPLSTQDSALVCGVRLSRGGEVLWLEHPDLSLQSGQVVVVAVANGEQLATVAVGSGQLAANETEVQTVGRVLRLATEEDTWSFGRRAAVALNAAAGAEALCRELGLQLKILDAWLAPDGGRLAFAVAASSPLEMENPRAALTGLFGLPVDLYRQNPAGTRELATGAIGVGLPSLWCEPLTAPKSEPEVRLLPEAPGLATARELIDRLFPSGGPSKPRAPGEE